jgi:hypothetical protein
MGFWGAVRSFGAAMRAGAAVGRSSRSRNNGDLRAALSQAREGLVCLGETYVRRGNPPEASALVSLTVIAEEVAVQLKEVGASTTDLADSILFLKRIDSEPRPELCSSIPFLEERLAIALSRPAGQS